MTRERPYATLYLMAIAMFALFDTIYEKFAIEMCMSLTRVFRMGQGKRKYANRRPHATFHVLTISMFVLFVTNREIITFELSNVLDSNVWAWKWRSRMLTIWIKIGRRRYLVNLHMYAKTRSSCLFAAHNSTFREGRTHAQTNFYTNIGPASIHRPYAVRTL